MPSTSVKRGRARREDAVEADPSSMVSLVDYLEAQADEATTKGERTRCRFKAAAARILGEKGYHAMRMDDISDAVGMSHGAIYEYFGNKKEITVEVLSDLNRRGIEIMRGVPPSTDEFSRLFRVNLLWVQVYRENAGLLRCQRQVSDDTREFEQQYSDNNTAWYERIADHMVQITRASPRNAESGRLLARALGCMADELLHDVYIRKVPGLQDLGSHPEALAEILTVFWYRLAYASNPPVVIEGRYRGVLGFVIGGSDE